MPGGRKGAVTKQNGNHKNKVWIIGGGIVVLVLLCILCLVTGFGLRALGVLDKVSIFAPTATSTFTVTPTATSTPTPTPTLTPMPTQTDTPTTTATEDLALGEEDYLYEILLVLDDFDVITSASAVLWTNADFNDPGWAEDIFDIFDLALELTERIRQIEPPQKYEQYHAIWLEIADNYDDYVEFARRGIRNLSVGDLEDALDSLGLVLEGAERANDLLEALIDE